MCSSAYHFHFLFSLGLHQFTLCFSFLTCTQAAAALRHALIAQGHGPGIRRRGAGIKRDNYVISCSDLTAAPFPQQQKGKNLRTFLWNSKVQYRFIHFKKRYRACLLLKLLISFPLFVSLRLWTSLSRVVWLHHLDFIAWGACNYSKSVFIEQKVFAVEPCIHSLVIILFNTLVYSFEIMYCFKVTDGALSNTRTSHINAIGCCDCIFVMCLPYKMLTLWSS